LRAYVLGSAGAYRNFAGQIGAKVSAAALIVHYQLAPEYLLACSLDDAAAVYRALSSSGVIPSTENSRGLPLECIEEFRIAKRNEHLDASLLCP
jgi:hypothetical protein